ncbi:unnamed protein product [Bursaphelenchus okinawaensis]|uniref:G_PROTEIN_RECEP_F1_2 domain-containing protein n=1 Tax=Bursaphelenchus okinawaensis TaxID=465554 RepID=A0A811L1L4_9BILA|nr:unnamed protein product [Bursaphelenchus okinawaensis]CAG9117059.1 unnamed protein product [Bursaphelenchus okinawaensis]
MDKNNSTSTVEKSTFLKVYCSNHTISTSLGVLLNGYLILVIYKCTRRSNQQVNLILMASTLNDLMFSLFELLLQHVIYQSDGIMYIISYGFDQNVGSNLKLILSCAHYFALIQVMTMQAALHSYRYLIISQERPPTRRDFIRRYILFSIPSIYLSVSYSVSAYYGLKHSVSHYTKTLPTAWQNSDGSNNVSYVTLWSDPATKFYVFNNVVVVAALFDTSMFYIYKCYKHVNTGYEKVSASTQKMRSQFNRCLISQTLVIAVLALIPSGIISMTYALQLHGTYLGAPSMMGFAWFGAINALIPLLYMDAFRNYSIRLIFCSKQVEIDNSVATTRSLVSVS